jgi:hypothetical protein
MPAAYLRALALAVAIGSAVPAAALTIDYAVTVPSPTGQTASADFSFLNATTVRIELSETTPAGDSAITGSLAVLAAIAFKLPDAVVIASSGHSAVIGASSATAGFATARGAGQEINAEWGATNGGEADFDGSGSLLGNELFDFVSTVGSSGVVQFPGTSYDGPGGLNGPQGGLLDDAAARGGLGIVDRAIVFTILLDANPSSGGNQGLSAAQQDAFLASLATGSAVMYSSHGSFGTPVPEPGTAALLALGLGGLALASRARLTS